ncbi:malto-oligosyltrehalose synthase [Parenemella sanctibonifatiensis]|uniref:Malto-oligosyltrehalose synthase n=1 Tax=Parenemella sanctibonifatiensis TaxID=2016505 RepID=A0A255EBW7_9ACTN|nr:malto-oligosyltrehalose synthase [Parenemella sanctibonifatiensis]
MLDHGPNRRVESRAVAPASDQSNPHDAPVASCPGPQDGGPTRLQRRWPSPAYRRPAEPKQGRSRLGPVSTPTSTYRLQITADFTLTDAAALVPQLRDLGVGALYLSPVLQATSGSDHGYDTTDPTMIDVSRGGEEGWRTLITAAREAGLGVVVDIVPNHLGISVPHENPAWWDVLAQGQDSPYADWFDISWEEGPILVPVLGDDEDNLLLDTEAGEIRYHEHRFPLAPASFRPGDDLAEVRQRQHYELCHWTEGDQRLTYRRFFAISTLAGVRQEDPAVFAATHQRIAGWIADGEVTGLRVDHPDGLTDPADYFTRLRELAPDAWIVGEKILEPGEDLPAWPIAGTTGYDALNEVLWLWFDPAREAEATAGWQQLTGDQGDAAAHIRDGKELAATTMLAAETTRVARLVAEAGGRAFPQELEAAIAALAIHFEVYRSYLPHGRELLDRAAELARAAQPDLTDTIAAVLPVLADPTQQAARRFQQLTGAVMAKGTEDTAFYRYARAIALNEVGGDAARFGTALADFHTAQERRQHHWPDAMTALSTHDTKRGEDVRARLAVLSELPREWQGYARQFVETGAELGVDAPMAYLLAQILVGTGPLTDRQRLYDYADKAAREAGTRTRWTQQDPSYEQALHALIDRGHDNSGLRDALGRLLGVVAPAGRVNALSQKLVQLTIPGVPDVYQGTELWDDSLVDPDNRRPVDHDRRRQLLAEIDSCPPLDETGRAKFWVVRQTLRLRRERPELFTGYTPVLAEGEAREHLVGFDRGGVITLATRLPVTLGAHAGPGWPDTTVQLPWSATDVLTGRQWSAGALALNAVFDRLPVALLVKD